MKLRVIITRLLSPVRHLSTYLGLFSGGLIVALMMVVVYEVWMRFVVHKPPGWAIEIPRLMFLAIIFLGLSYATKMEGHVNLDVLITRLSWRPRAMLKMVTSFLALGVSSVLLWQSITILIDSYRQNWRTATVVPIIEWPFYVTMVTGVLVMCLEWVAKIVAGYHDFRKPPESGRIM